MVDVTTKVADGIAMGILLFYVIFSSEVLNTYFTFQNKYYEQVEEAATSSPISPIVANLYMENFEVRAINTSPHPPLMWKRFVDDTFVVIKAAHKQEFLEHINSTDHHIQFTRRLQTRWIHTFLCI